MDRTDKLRLLSAALATAEERERRVLAQDLHDDLGQMLAVVALKAATLQKQKHSLGMQRVVDDLTTAVDQANRKLRTMALQLNPPMLDQLGFAPAIEWLIEEMHRIYNLDVNLTDDGTPKPMDPAVSATLFRAVRELLINVSKHARVAHASVVARHGDGNTLVVTVNDAGAGFEPAGVEPASAGGGFGLLSVQERLGYLGGSMLIRSNPGDGTSVVLTVPLLAPTVASPENQKTGSSK
jgi:signal transduction histidine kinase